MKIVSNAVRAVLKSGTALGFLLVMGSAMAGPAHAVDAMNASPPSSMPPPPETMASASETPAALPAPTASAASSKNLAPLEDKVTDSVKNVVKQFGSVDTINLEDLNTARQAVVKLEVLIDIEKHLAELDKIRADRNGTKNLSSVLPASALGLPSPMPAAMPSFAPKSTDQASFMPPPPVAHNDVSRIIGADGRYTAVIQGKNYRVGDSLPDGSMIVSVTSRAVETKLKDGTIHVIHVKGVDEVFGHTL